MKKDSNHNMNYKLLETVADIAYYAGQKSYYSGNSRQDMMDFIWWAKEFEEFHENTDWDTIDYMLTIEEYTEKKLYLKLSEF